MYTKYSKIRRGSATEGEALEGRVLSPPSAPIPSTKDATTKSDERKRSKHAENSSSGATAESEPESETRIMFEIKRRTARLRACADHSCQNCLDDLAYIESKIIHDHSESVTQMLLENEFVEIFQHTLGQFFRRAAAAHTEADSIASNDFISAMLSACRIVTKLTDISSEACRNVIQLELYIDIIMSLKLTKQNLSPALLELAEALIVVLYNVVQVTIEARELYREHDIMEVIESFQTGTTISLSALTLVFMPWVISDEDTYTHKSNYEVFCFLTKELRSSLDHKVSHRSDYGYKAVELLTTLNSFPLTDTNKERFFKTGILSSYVAFLDPQFDAEEQCLAAEGIWARAFKCATEVKKEKSCIERLELLLMKTEDEAVRIQVNGALIALGAKEDSPIQTPKLS